MTGVSSIRRLRPDIREMIGRLRVEGRTHREILAALRERGTKVSKGALARHLKSLDGMGAQIAQSRAVAEALVAPYAEAGESKAVRLTAEILHTHILKLLVGADGESGRPEFEPKELLAAATALKQVAQATKLDAEREVRVRKDLAAAMIDKIDDAMQEAKRRGETGLSAERIAQLRREFLGVAA